MIKTKLLMSVIFFSVFFSLEGNPRLEDSARNVYSQFGEDGIIETILNQIGSTTKICIEFGAWDGFKFSNTANLWVNQGWQGILIECNKEHFDDLVRNVTPYNTIPIFAAVGIEFENRLETILESYQITTPIDLLSIDIDGNDYHVLRTIENLHPRIIICEYNPSIPSHIDLYPQYHNSVGASLKAITRIANEKGYRLVATTITNAIFVDEKEADKLSNYEMTYELVSSNRFCTYVVSDYHGNYILISDQDQFPWGLNSNKINEKIEGNFNRFNNLSILKK